MSANRQRLDDDVLWLVMSLCSRPDLLSFMSTAHKFHRSGISILLRDVSVNQDSVSPFCAFMLVDMNVRARLLQRLDMQIVVTRKVKNRINTLVAIIQGADNLRELSIGNLEELLDFSPKLFDAIRSREGMTTIDFHDAGPLCAKLLSNLRSPLTRINIDGVRPVRIDWFAMITPFANTLEYIFFETTYLDALAELQTIFPRVDELWFTPAVLKPNQTIYRQLTHCFPCLTKLYCYSAGTQGEDISMEDLHLCRSTNRANPPQVRWPALDLIDGLVDNFYALGLDCHVHKMYCSFKDQKILKTVMLDCSVDTLHFELGPPWEVHSVDRRVESMSQVGSVVVHWKMNNATTLYDILVFKVRSSLYR